MRMRRLLAVLTSGTVLGLAACVSGCGSSRPQAIPSASSLKHGAKVALDTALSVRVTGWFRAHGEFTKMDVGYMKSGDSAGSVTGPFTGGANLTYHFIVAAGKLYVLVDKQYFDANLLPRGVPASKCATHCGKYMKITTNQLHELSLRALMDQLFGAMTKLSPAVTATTIDGRPAYRVHDTVDDNLYVSSDGTDLPLEMSQPGSAKVVFSEWNSIPPIPIPHLARAHR